LPQTPPPEKRSAMTLAIAAVVLPVAAFALAWLIAGKFPLAVPVREWGTWFVIGTLLCVAGLAGLVCAFRAFMRKGWRGVAAAGLVLSLMAMLIAWAGLFG
jgi:hypothetical protein